MIGKPGMLAILGVALAIGAPAVANHESKMLIIAPRAFHESLSDFIIHKQLIRPTELIDLEDALDDGGAANFEEKPADDAEALKRYLYSRWKAEHIRFVLLVGDADVMPVRYMALDRVTTPAFDYAFYPSDLYYGDLAKPAGAFEDWNASHEDFHAHYFGEVRGEKNKSDPMNFDQIDYKPEIAVGRWPVSTIDELKTIADKTIRFEKASVNREARAPRAIALVACGGWIENRPAMDQAATAFDGWKVHKLYFEQSPPPDEQHVTDVINGGVDLVLHSGHGSDDRWEGSISSASITKLNNSERFPIMMSAGCSTARFATLPPYESYVDQAGVEHIGTNSGEVFTAPPPAPACYQRGKNNPSGLGEQLLRGTPNGAIAYIGCNTGSQPCGMALMEGFANSIGTRKDATVGECWMDAITFYYDQQKLGSIKPDEGWYPASIFFQGMKFMFFGDPSLPIAGA